MPFIRRLIWDAWNIAHIARHDVTPDEVEEVCQGRALTFTAHKGRILLIGTTAGARTLAIVLEPIRPDVYYIVTARPASRKERRLYREAMAGGKKIGEATNEE
ncbi:MAG: BrnT family toxin [Anaerolineae bacterium]|nr:BrnT family toxin [Anaerolineae bacterium]